MHITHVPGSGPHAESIAVEFARRVADRATPPALRSALLLFLAAAFDTQPGLVPHLLRQADGGAVPLLRALHRLLDDERADAALRRQALAALEAIYSASPELLASLRASDAFWRSLLRVLTAPAARPSPDDWHVRAHVLRLLALEAHAAPAPDSPVAKALDAPLSETLKAAGLPDALEAVLSKATEGALAALRDDAVPHAERLARLAAAARLSALPRLATQGDADAFVYDAAALSAHPELARATRAWNVMLCRAAALDALAAAALRLVVAAAARKFAPLTSRVAPAVAARLLAWLAHLFDGALAPEGERAQYPLLPLGLPVFCPVFAALVARITLSLVQLLLHLLNSLRAPPAGVALPSPTRLALLAALLLQRALRASAPSVPLLRAVQALLLLALRTDAARDEALRGGVLEALLAAQVRLLALGPELVPSVYAVLARLHHAASTPHFAAAGLYERLSALLVPALAAADAAPAQALLQLLVALAAEPSAAEALVAHGALFALAKPSAADDALWPAHVALVVRLLAALRAVESGRDGLQQWLELLRPALLRSLAPPSPRAPAPLASLLVAERVALLLRHLVLASRQWRSAAHLAPTEAEVLALLALLSALTSLAFQPQLLERAFVSEGGDGFPVRAEEAVLGAVRAVLQTLLAVCAAQPALVLLLPYVSSTPPAHLSDSPLPTMGAFADWIVALADLLLPADAPDAPAPPRSASHKALILRVADLCVALCLHHARLFLTEPAHEPLRRRFRSEVVAELDGHVARLVQGLRAKRVALDTDLMVRAQEALAAMRRDPGSGPGAAAADAPRAALLV